MSSIVTDDNVPLLTRSSRARKGISLTALIDVVFILLMFFMLTSTFIKLHKVQLQTAAAGDEVVKDQKTVQPQLIIIRESNHVDNNQGDLTTAGGFSLLTSSLVNGKHEQKFTRLTQLITQLDPAIAIVILPEPQVQVQMIIDSLMQLKSANFERVTLGNTLGTTSTKIQNEV